MIQQYRVADIRERIHVEWRGVEKSSDSARDASSEIPIAILPSNLTRNLDRFLIFLKYYGKHFDNFSYTYTL